MLSKINKISRLLLVAFISGWVFTPSTAQISWTFFPKAPAQINSFFEIGNSLMIGTENGVYRLSSDGMNWVSASVGLPEKLSVRGFTTHGNSLFIQTDKGFFISKDQGNNWSVVNVPTGVTNLGSNGAILFGYWREPTPILYRSINNGETWEVATDKLPSIYFIYVTGNDLFVLQSNFASQHGFLRSRDNGQNWTAIRLPQFEYNLSITINNGFLYVAGTQGGATNIYCSSDRGNSWEFVSTVTSYIGPSLQVSGANITINSSSVEPPNGISYRESISSDLGRTWLTSSILCSSRDAGSGIICPPYSFYISLYGEKIYSRNAADELRVSRDFTKPVVAAVSAANYKIGSLSKESIVSVFGSGLTLTTAAAASVPLPTSLENISVTITDSKGVEKLAPLFYISPTQINFQIPAGLANGVGTATVNLYNQIVGRGVISIATISPGLFTVNQTGEGFAAANVQRVKTDGTSIFQPTAQYNSTANKFTGIPINVSSATDQVYLNLYGTGIRGRSDLANVKATVGGVDVPVVYAGAHGSFVGVDQINVLLPPTLAGKGEVDIILSVDNQVANTVKIFIQ